MSLKLFGKRKIEITTGFFHFISIIEFNSNNLKFKGIVDSMNLFKKWLFHFSNKICENF